MQERTILFAPVALGETLAAEYPDGAQHFASDMATRIQALVPGARAWVSATIPVSDDEDWTTGAPGAASGAHLIILTTIDQVLEEHKVSGVRDADRIYVRVTQRALDIGGQQQWFKTVIGDAPLAESPKKVHPGGQLGAAAWDGCKKALTAFKFWLTKTGGEGLDKRTTHSGDPVPDPIDLVDLGVDSTPQGADIYVNGVFRGRTPMQVPLPQAAIELRLELEGHQSWSRSLTPVTDMQLSPTMQPVE